MNRLLLCTASLAFVLIGLNCGPTASKETISISKPVAGDKFLVGDTVTVHWTPSVTSPQFSYQYNNGIPAWKTFDAASVLASTGTSATLILPSTWYSDSFFVKISDGTGAVETGTSPRFSVKHLIITSPTSNQTFKTGQSVPITWRADLKTIPSIEIKISTDGGRTYSHIINHSLAPDTAQPFLWIVGSEDEVQNISFPSTTCYLKFSQYSYDPIRDVVGPFTVTK